MAGKQQTPQAQAPSEGAEPEEPGAAPWWRRRATLVAVAALLAALALGAVLLAGNRTDSVGDSSADGAGGSSAEDRVAAGDEDGAETADEDTPGGGARDSDGGQADRPGPGSAAQRDPDAPPQPGTGAPPPEGTSGAGEAESPNLDVTPEAFRERWNIAVGELGRGYPLDEIVVEDPGPGPEGEAAEYPVEQPMDAFGRIEVRVRPDGLVSSAVVEGEPTNAGQQQDYEATLAAAVAAVTGTSAAQAADLLATDLGLDGADPNHHVAGTEIDGVVIQIEAASGLWSFYIGGPWTA